MRGLPDDVGMADLLEYVYFLEDLAAGEVVLHVGLFEGFDGDLFS